MADVFVWAPTYGSALTKKPDVTRTQFGDGYEQRIGAGMNILKRKWDLTFANRTNTVSDAIDGFLTGLNGLKSFTWTPPTGASGKWVCMEWSVQPTSQNSRTVTASFEEVFEA